MDARKNDSFHSENTHEAITIGDHEPTIGMEGDGHDTTNLVVHTLANAHTCKPSGYDTGSPERSLRRWHTYSLRCMSFVLFTYAEKSGNHMVPRLPNSAVSNTSDRPTRTLISTRNR